MQSASYAHNAVTLVVKDPALSSTSKTHGSDMVTLALISSYAPSLVRFRGALIEDLVRAGVRVVAFAPDYCRDLRRAVRELGAEPVDYSLARSAISPLRDIIDALKLAYQLSVTKPDVALTYFAKPVIYGSIAAWLVRVPRRYAMIEGLGYVFMNDEHSSVPSRRCLRYLVVFLYRVACRRCHKVFFLNDDDEAEFIERGIVKREQCAKLDGIGVDLEHYRYSRPVISPVTFVLVARLLREKGVFDFVAAARIVKQRRPDARFILVGGLDSNPGAIRESDAVAWQSEGLLQWLGHVDDVRPWLAAASVFVLPSYGEGKPRSVQEAMAMGRAIITTDVSGCRETVQVGVNGLLVPVRDPTALADAMLEFIARPELIERMGIESRRMAENRFDVIRINKQIRSEIDL